MLPAFNDFFVFLKADYVRDAQGFLNGHIDDFDDIHDSDEAWRDVCGPMLLMNVAAINLEEVIERIDSVYPHADKRVFEIVQANTRRINFPDSTLERVYDAHGTDEFSDHTGYTARVLYEYDYMCHVRFCDGLEADVPARNLENQTCRTIFDGKHTYTVVDEFPLGYVPWNIGKYAPEGYLPLCRYIAPDSCSIDPKSLKAIRCEGAQEILACTSATGLWHPSELKRYLECNETNPRKRYEVERVRNALPHIEKLKF